MSADYYSIDPMKETEQTLLENIKDQVAKETHGMTWDESVSWEHNMWPIVCERYATAKAQASCEAKWISVKDRLPEIGQEVNVIVIGNRVTSLARKIRYEGDKEYSWDNSYPGSGNWHAKEAVTHWQPLPEPPVENLDV